MIVFVLLLVIEGKLFEFPLVFVYHFTNFSLIFGLRGSDEDFVVFEAIPHLFKGLVEEDDFLVDAFPFML